jgi:hypothetical protein
VERGGDRSGVLDGGCRGVANPGRQLDIALAAAAAAEWPLLARPASALTILAALLTALCYIGLAGARGGGHPLPLRPRALYALRWHRQTLV